MEIRNKIINKVRSVVKRTYNQAAPIVKKEIQKTVEKGKENVICSVIDGLGVAVMGAILISVVVRPSDILGNPAKDEPRNIYNSYYEVHITNNYYSKGEK